MMASLLLILGFGGSVLGAESYCSPQPSNYQYYSQGVYYYSSPTTASGTHSSTKFRFFDLPAGYSLYVIGNSTSKHVLSVYEGYKEIQSPAIPEGIAYFYSFYLVGVDGHGGVTQYESSISFKAGETKNIYLRDFRLRSAPSIREGEHPRKPIEMPRPPERKSDSPVRFEIQAGKTLEVDLGKTFKVQGDFHLASPPAWLELSKEGVLKGRPTVGDLGNHHLTGSVTVSSPGRDDIGIFKLIIKVIE